jgi:hypothetical protein
VSRTPDPAGLAGFLLWGSVPEPFTSVRGIRQLPAGAFLVVDETGPHEPVLYFSIAAVLRDAERSAASPEAASKAVTDSVAFQRELHVKEEEDAERAIKAEGCEIVTLDAAQHDAFATAVQPIYAEARKLLGDELFKLT